MIINLRERKDENSALRRQFDSVIEYVDVLTEFLEKLRAKTHLNGCAMCGWELGDRVNMITQTEELG